MVRIGRHACAARVAPARRDETKVKVGEVRAGAYRSDPALVQACIDGDEGAWYELVERYSRLVYSIALRNGFPAAMRTT